MCIHTYFSDYALYILFVDVTHWKSNTHNLWLEGIWSTYFLFMEIYTTCNKTISLHPRAGACPANEQVHNFTDLKALLLVDTLVNVIWSVEKKRGLRMSLQKQAGFPGVL